MGDDLTPEAIEVADLWMAIPDDTKRMEIYHAIMALDAKRRREGAAPVLRLVEGKGAAHD